MEKHLISDNNKSVWLKNYKVIFAILTLLPMYAVNAFMKYVGNDYGNYYTYFLNITSGDGQDVDIAYRILCEVLGKLGLDFQWTYYILCAIAYALLMICIYKFSGNFAISYLLFFFNGYFALLGLNQIRQFVSVVLVFLAYDCILKKKPMQYIVLVLLATTFHFTAIIMLPFYWILNKRWKLSVYLIISAVLFPINFFFNDILTWLYATFLPRYLTSDYASREFKIDVVYLCMVITTAVVILLYEKRSQKVNYVFRNCIMLSLVIALFASWIPDYKRFVYYFFIPSIAYLPDLLQGEEKKRKIIAYAFVFAASSLYLYMAHSEWGILPYHSIFS